MGWIGLVAWMSLAGVGMASPVHQDQTPAQPSSDQADVLQTVAERSGFRATSRYQDVMAFCRALDASSDLVTLTEMGKTVEGRSIPVLILADPPVRTPQQAKDSGKLVVFAFGDIHAGEVCGKEALMILARNIVQSGEHAPLLKNLVILLAPIYNADGNDRFSKDHRGNQVGPEEGTGQRHNAQDLDLNRDYIKLESPEARALVRFENRWDPAVSIDTHTTNGSHHQYTITYEGPRNPAGDPRIIEFVRKTMLPKVALRMETETAWRTFFYGNFDRDKTTWTTYPDTPRYGTIYRGMRNRIAILSEAYAYASYEDRVRATEVFVRFCFRYASAEHKTIGKLIRQADKETTEAGQNPSEDDLVPIRTKIVDEDEAVIVRGYIEEERQGRLVPTDQPRDYRVRHVARSKPTLSVVRPYAYVIPARYENVRQTLQRHGIRVEQFREDIDVPVETYTIDTVERAERSWQGHRLVQSVEATPKAETRRIQAGTLLIRTGQPLGSLIVYLLEPQSADGLCTWNFFDGVLETGKEFPVWRIPSPVTATIGPVRPLPEDRTMDRPITYETVFGSGRPPNFRGSPISIRGWADGTHFLVARKGGMDKVDALTGAREPYRDPEPMAEALAKLDAFSKKQARSVASGTRFTMDPDKKGALITEKKDLYYAAFDGSLAVQLTDTPHKREELASFSPDGQRIAFVRDNDLYTVDLATQTERRLTTGGGGLVTNGKNDWVYYEEIFNRNRRAYWWSPDSTALAFLHIDDAPIHTFTLTDFSPTRERLEQTRYPKAGDPNPIVQVGIVTVDGGDPIWADLAEQDPQDLVISGVGWMSDSRHAYAYVQDRAQTRLDFTLVDRADGKTLALYRDTTGAWVESPGEPKFLTDGSFLISSERTGWRHYYHYSAEGELIAPVTTGEWEARRLEYVDEAGGWIYVSGTRDTSIASNLYRVRLDGTGIERLTRVPGSHRVSFSPDGLYYVDTWSSHDTPTRVALFQADGTPVRALDTNPVYTIEEYRHSPYELMQIPMRDGFKIEAAMIRPPDFDPSRRYPVWLMTYAGPHAPTVSDTWSGGRVFEQMVAQMGIIVFRCDPRSASGKGAVSAWEAYRQMGVSEMRDLDDAVAWLDTLPYVDAARVGMSGHSYGGFMTAYALTHSERFCCGIAGSPVTDWRLYDTIYTERYMNTPQNNPEGYEKTSVIRAAGNLHGRLLLLHGTMDDNVHMQQTINLVDALIKADKQFDLMLYPGFRHGIWGTHYNRLRIDFMRRHLLGGSAGDTEVANPAPVTASP